MMKITVEDYNKLIYSIYNTYKYLISGSSANPTTSQIADIANALLALEQCKTEIQSRKHFENEE